VQILYPLGDLDYDRPRATSDEIDLAECSPGPATRSVDRRPAPLGAWITLHGLAGESTRSSSALVATAAPRLRAGDSLATLLQETAPLPTREPCRDPQRNRPGAGPTWGASPHLTGPSPGRGTTRSELDQTRRPGSPSAGSGDRMARNWGCPAQPQLGAPPSLRLSRVPGPMAWTSVAGRRSSLRHQRTSPLPTDDSPHTTGSSPSGTQVGAVAPAAVHGRAPLTECGHGNKAQGGLGRLCSSPGERVEEDVGPRPRSAFRTTGAADGTPTLRRTGQASRSAGTPADRTSARASGNGHARDAAPRRATGRAEAVPAWGSEPRRARVRPRWN